MKIRGFKILERIVEFRVALHLYDMVFNLFGYRVDRFCYGSVLVLQLTDDQWDLALCKIVKSIPRRREVIYQPNTSNQGFPDEHYDIWVGVVQERRQSGRETRKILLEGWENHVIVICIVLRFCLHLLIGFPQLFVNGMRMVHDGKRLLLS